ncbi:MAG: SGNH hydrolase, partial [Gordonia sp. (in: high G+C Gram-positive bacteria)]
MSETSPSFKRFVAIGDSFAEGVGDVEPRCPNGVRGWADRVAEVMAREDPEFRYANLAIRGRLLPAVLGEQLEPALAMKPDLATICAGANDLLRPSVDIDALIESYDAAVGRLQDAGATVIAFTAYDTG